MRLVNTYGKKQTMLPYYRLLTMNKKNELNEQQQQQHRHQHQHQHQQRQQPQMKSNTAKLQLR